MKTEFRYEIQTFKDSHFRNVMKSNFTGVFGWVFLYAFTPNTIKATFTATGVFPFNPDIIPEKAMKPSLLSSIKGSFPLPQPSPIKAILSAMGSCPPTNFDLSPSHQVTGPSHVVLTSPVTPSNKTWPWFPVVNPSLKTPFKRIRILYGALALKSSGSMLVSMVKMTSSYKIPKPVLKTVPDLPQPDWTLLGSSHSGTCQSWEALEQQNHQLTNSLARSQDIICTHELIDKGRAT
jgi:hypothetical protein